MEPAIWGLYSQQAVNEMGRDEFIRAQSLTQKYKSELSKLIGESVKVGVIEALAVLLGEGGDKK